MDRDFFKGAIAEAKTVRESAIANAKAALEEAFEPKMRSMLATKLEEMEEMDEEATYEGEKEDYKMEGKEEVEELDLDEILAELEGELEEDNSEEMLKEEEEMESEEEDMESEEEMDSEEEDIDLEDMTEDELKKFIEDVIEDMVQAGELEAGDNAEEEEGEEEDEEIEMEDDMEDLNEDELNELFGLGKNKKKDEIEAAAAKAWEASDKSDDKKKSIQLDVVKKLRKAGLDAGPSTMADFRRKVGMEKDERSLLQKVATGASGGRSKVTSEELSEAVDTINILKSELHEINLLNSKLLYSNKIFKTKNLTESQKVKVLNAFDSVSTTKEAKLVFETLSNSISKSKTSIKESRMGSASKSITKPAKATKQPIVESNEMVNRFQKLAGII